MQWFACAMSRLLRSLLALPLAFALCKEAARRPRFFSRGVDNEREEVSKDVLRELSVAEVRLPHLLFGVL